MTRQQDVTIVAPGRRWWLRRLKSSVGTLIKCAIELITNAEAEYHEQDLANGGRRSFYGDLADLVSGQRHKLSSAKPIMVVADARTRRIQVIDRGRGFPIDKMERTILREDAYGEDMASSVGQQGVPKRSLFGQGLFDVLHVHRKGNIKSVVDDVLYSAKAVWKDQRPGWQAYRGKQRRVDTQTRESLRLLKGNGTVVEFELNPDIRKRWPAFNEIYAQLNLAPSLRMINLDPTRSLQLIWIDKEGQEATHECRYIFPPGNHVGELEDSWQFADTSISISATLWRSEDGLAATPGSDDRQNGLLVIDENDAVLDLTLFGFDGDPDAGRLFGVVRLEGAARIIRERLNQGDEILMDEREGLNPKHDFYRQLRSRMDSWLKPFVAAEKQAQTASGEPPKPLSRRLSSALKVLNRLYKELAEPEGGGSGAGNNDSDPGDGLRFTRPSVAFTSGAFHVVDLLVAPPKFSTLHEIEISSSNPNIEVQPGTVRLTGTDLKQEVLTKRLRLTSDMPGEKAQIRAYAIKDDGAPVETQCDVSVLPVVIPVLNQAMEFMPGTSIIAPGRKHSAHLYIDTTLIPVGSMIELAWERNADSFVCYDSAIVINDECHLAKCVGKVDISITGFRIQERNVLRATYGSHSAVLELRVEQRDPTPDKSGFFRGPLYRPLRGWSRRTLWDSEGGGYIVVNSEDELNRVVFGTLEEFERSLSESAAARAVLADLMLEEYVWSTVHKRWQNGKIVSRSETIVVEELRNDAALIRQRVGRLLFDALNDEQTLAGLLRDGDATQRLAAAN